MVLWWRRRTSYRLLACLSLAGAVPLSRASPPVEVSYVARGEFGRKHPEPKFQLIYYLNSFVQYFQHDTVQAEMKIV